MNLDGRFLKSLDPGLVEDECVPPATVCSDECAAYAKLNAHIAKRAKEVGYFIRELFRVMWVAVNIVFWTLVLDDSTLYDEMYK